MPTSSANLGYGSNKLWNWIFVALPGEFACKRGQATAYQKKREKKKNPHLVSDFGSGDLASPYPPETMQTATLYSLRQN